ncbi:MAG: DNA polymerase III subunit gamma/tau [Saprospiraceae bacterium]
MSQFIVSARKYRPARFEDVVGQAHVAGTLKNALATDHVAHAFLFTGPRGVGKTTCARILAKVLNCENRTPDFEACNECSSCRAFNENASFNIIELDAASNNSVDHIRALVEQVRFQPQQGRYKVFIIDEVHMLSNQAFNAFLKTLEEPPPYAIFILATTEKHKIIPTILSRCQIFDFRRITIADMVAHLQAICRKENIEAEEDALHIIAQKADGALRDALSIFDRICASAAGRKIRYEDVIENLNVLDYDYFFQMTDALLGEDLPGVLNLFEQIQRKGFEPDTFVNGLAEHLRNVLVCKDEATLALLETGENLRERYRRQAALAPASFVLTCLGIANDCDVNYKMARHKRLHVEMALIKMTFISRAISAAKNGGSPAIPEKKTLDLNGGRLTVDGGQPATQSEPPKTQQLTLAAEPEEQYAMGSGQLAVGSGQSAENPPPSPLHRPPSTGKKSLFSLESYEAEVEKEERLLAEKESRLTLENAQAEWKKYAEGVDSQRLRLVMTEAEMRLEAETIIVKVGMATSRNLLMDENNRITDHLRQALHDPRLKLRVDLDEAQAESLRAAPPPRRAMTNKERFDQMREQNPLVLDLVKRFELKLED